MVKNILYSALLFSASLSKEEVNCCCVLATDPLIKEV